MGRFTAQFRNATIIFHVYLTIHAIISFRYSLHQGIDLVVSGNMKENSVKKHINNDKLNWRLKNYELCKTLSSGDLSEYNYIGRQKSLQKVYLNFSKEK